jgi:hypothetical protein
LPRGHFRGEIIRWIGPRGPGGTGTWIRRPSRGGDRGLSGWWSRDRLQRRCTGWAGKHSAAQFLRTFDRLPAMGALELNRFHDARLCGDPAWRNPAFLQFLMIGNAGGPTARGHTSLGQRPRLPDGIISEGLKARSIGLAWRAPTGLRGSVRRKPGPLAQAGMGRAVGAGGGGTERGFSNPRLDSWLADRNVRPPLASRKVARRWRCLGTEGLACFRLASCRFRRAKGPESYQPGPSAQVA